MRKLKNWQILMATLSERLQGAIEALKGAGIDGAEIDARRLVAYALSISQEELLASAHTPFPLGAESRLCRALKARLAHQPVSQILGQRLFWGRPFKITPAVLDPRPETECLIEQALQIPFKKVLDIGTGSGALLLSLLSEAPDAQGLGVDISQDALKIARQNAENLGLSERAQWQQSDWLSNVDATFDLIVANPPYITRKDYAALAKDVREWEPEIALCISEDGLEAYRAILKDIHKNLAHEGRVIFEIGHTQEKDVAALMQSAGLSAPICVPDLDGRARVLCAQAPRI